MRRLLTALVLMLPLIFSACASYAVHLYSDPQLLQVIDERLVLREADVPEETDPLAVLMRGDSVVVIGERRGNWEYELDMHDRYYVIYFNGHRSYVSYRSLITVPQYAAMFGPGSGAGSTGTAGTVATGAGAATGSSAATGNSARDAAAAPPSGDPTGGDPTGGADVRGRSRH